MTSMLSTSEYKEYIAQCISLARSIRIKQPQTITAMNEWQKLMGDNTSDLTTEENWKYYKHLCGEYYQPIGMPWNDMPMYIEAYDGLIEPITITDEYGETNTIYVDDNKVTLGTVTTYLDKQLAVNYPITYSALQSKGSLYLAMVDKYPYNESLLEGIINPLTMVQAINAKDYQILSYDSTLVEVNETGLMTHLQEWLFTHTDRWDVPAFAMTDTLYPATNLATLYNGLLLEIINYRLLQVKTYQAHSFHVNTYLKGYFRIGYHLNTLSLPVRMYLYRNIEYFTKEGGNEFCINELDLNIIRKNDIRLTDYNLVNTGSELLSSARYTDNGEENITPVIDLVHLMDELATLNPDVDSSLLTSLAHNREYTLNPKLPTAIFKVEQNKLPEDLFVRSIEVRYGTWLHGVNHGYIKMPIHVPGIGAGSTPVVLSPSDAVAILQYCALILQKETEPTLGIITYSGVVSHQHSGDDVLASVIEPSVSTNYNGSVGSMNRLLFLKNLYTPAPDIITVNDLELWHLEQIRRKILHVILANTEDGGIRRSQLDVLINDFEEQASFYPVSEQTFDQLFTRVGIDSTLLVNDTLLETISLIVKTYVDSKAESWYTESTTEAVTFILKALCSYTASFIPSESRTITMPVSFNPMTISNELNKTWVTEKSDILILSYGLEFKLAGSSFGDQAMVFTIGSSFVYAPGLAENQNLIGSLESSLFSNITNTGHFASINQSNTFIEII